MRNLVLIAALFSHYFSLSLQSQEDKLYTCLNYPGRFDERIDRHNELIDSILSLELGDNYLFRFMETCKEGTPEYGFQLQNGEAGDYFVIAFRFSSEVWSLIYNNRMGELKLIKEQEKISPKLVVPLVNVLNCFFNEQDTVSSGPIYPGGSCYKFYYKRNNSLICGLVTSPNDKTQLLVNIMDLMSDFSSHINEVELLNQLNNLLFELENY